ncbi:MAG: hypothetical protein R2856_01605 [Caldilineaceae bacterium]
MQAVEHLVRANAEQYQIGFLLRWIAGAVDSAHFGGAALWARQ